MNGPQAGGCHLTRHAHVFACVMSLLGCSDIERTTDHLDETARLGPRPLRSFPIQVPTRFSDALVLVSAKRVA